MLIQEERCKRKYDRSGLQEDSPLKLRLWEALSHVL